MNHVGNWKRRTDLRRRRGAMTVLFFCLAALPSQANLGETVAQCVARYGSPIHYSEATGQAPFGTVTFVAAGYGLILFIFKGREVGARISKVDKSPLSEAERQAMMAADSGPSPWIPAKSDDPTCLEWSRSDHATVLYDKDKHMLIFTSPEMAQAMAAPPPKPTPGN